MKQIDKFKNFLKVDLKTAQKKEAVLFLNNLNSDLCCIVFKLYKDDKIIYKLSTPLRIKSITIYENDVDYLTNYSPIDFLFLCKDTIEKAYMEQVKQIDDEIDSFLLNE